MTSERKAYLEDEDLTGTDRALYDLLEGTAEPIPWRASDDAILAFARIISEGAASNGSSKTAAAPSSTTHSGDAQPVPETSTTATGDETRVFRFAPRSRGSFRRFAASPVVGLAIAASLTLGVFGGQAIIPYFNVGLSPGYEQLVAENLRLNQEVSLTRSMRARHGKGDASAFFDANKDAFPLGLIVFDFPCSNLTASLSSNRELSVSGYVANRDDFSRLQTSLLDFEDLASVKNNVSIYAWPYCQVIGVLQQATLSSGRADSAPIIRPFNHSERYAEGESLVVEAINNAGYEAYVYVDYIQEDGEVVHILPSRGKPKNKMAPGERVMLGVGAVPYVIEPPFGTDMISIVVSPSPLFDEMRDEVESVQVYVPALHDALKQIASGGEGDRLLSSFTFIETTERVTPKAERPGLRPATPAAR